MTRRDIRIRQEHAARTTCTELLQQLRLEIAAGPWRVIEVMENAARCLLEHTGGNLYTQALRTELAECQRLIAQRRGGEIQKRRRALKLVVNAPGGES